VMDKIDVPLTDPAKEKPPVTRGLVRAGDRIRTGDPHLGKVMLYH
jgi:hypothetical protein